MNSIDFHGGILKKKFVRDNTIIGKGGEKRNM